MDIGSLQAFIAVAREQSFSKASERLFITQPAVSKRVAALEDELGVELFNRVARQISLTEAGKQLLVKARELVSQAEELQKYASNLNDDVSGNLSIAIAHHIGLHRMPPILKRFNQQYSNVHLDIRFEDSDQAFHSVEQGDIEFAVITLPQSLPEKLIMRPVWEDELQVVVSREHVLASREQLTFDSLAEYSCVLPSKDTETHQIMQRKFDELGLEMQVQMQTNNLETLKMLVGAGLGWSLLPTTMLNTGDVTALSLGKPLFRQLGMVFHAKRSLSNAARALRDMIVSQTETVDAL